MTQGRHTVLNSRLHIGMIICILLALVLVGCGASTTPGTGNGTPGTTSTPVSTTKGAGLVIVQLFRTPGFRFPPLNGIPDWTLYGDGTLIFKVGSELLQAQLTPGEVQHILDVIVNQNTFFASSQNSYGRIVPDIGSTLLSVTANGQHKEVRLFIEPTSGEDQQTQHVFAIEHFLLNYRPTTTQIYMPPGIVLLVQTQTGAGTGGVHWLYNDISLAQVANQECTYLQFGTNNCVPDASGKAGVFPIYGKRGVSLWQQWQLGPYTEVSQDGKSFQVIIWPLLPDDLVPRADGAYGIVVQGSNGGIWPLLAGAKN